MAFQRLNQKNRDVWNCCKVHRKHRASQALHCTLQAMPLQSALLIVQSAAVQVATLTDKLARSDCARAKQEERRTAAEAASKRTVERASQIEASIAVYKKSLEESKERESSSQVCHSPQHASCAELRRSGQPLCTLGTYDTVLTGVFW